MLLVILVIVVLPWLFPGFDPIGWIIMPPFEWLAERYFNLAVAVAGH